MEDRYQGCLLGLAVGDALGFPTEFLTAAEIQRQWGPEGLTTLQSYHNFPPGTFTDDTQMSLALARGLLAVPDGDLDTTMQAVAQEFVAWSRSSDNNRSPGITCMAGCRHLAEGVPWRFAGVRTSKGCGAAMRTAPLGLRFHGDPARLIEFAAASSQLTHGHPNALAGAVATALAVSLALDNVEPRSILERLIEATRPISDEFAVHLGRVPATLEREPEDAFAILGDAWVAEEAVADALYCFLRHPTDYARTVLTGANASGDSDSIACIAGAISGAYNGRAAIPEHWQAQLEKRDELLEVAQRLHALRWAEAASDAG